jgi:hypothetical protein
MRNTTQIKFPHKSITSYISTTTFINYHATYIVLELASSVKYIFPLLIDIIFFICMFSVHLITKASPTIGYAICSSFDMIQERSNSDFDVKCAIIQFMTTIIILNPTVGLR